MRGTLCSASASASGEGLTPRSKNASSVGMWRATAGQQGASCGNAAHTAWQHSAERARGKSAQGRDCKAGRFEGRAGWQRGFGRCAADLMEQQWLKLTTGCQVDSCQVRTALGGRAKVQEVGQGRECFGAVLGLNHCLQG